MINRPHIVALLGLTLLPASRADAGDPRIRQIAYDPKSVTILRGCFGFQSTVAFAPGEQVENVALGDAQLWQVTPNKRSDLLFLKPTVRNGRTNMMVVTDRRRYAFDLTARDDGSLPRGPHHLRTAIDLSGPASASHCRGRRARRRQRSTAARRRTAGRRLLRNTAYTFTGTVANVPTRAFDDGHATYLRWADGAEAPAIYALGPGKTETLVNFAIKGDYVVVDGVEPAFVLRRGAAVAVLYNDAYQQPKLDADAPQPRAEAGPKPGKHSLFARLLAPAATSPENGR